MLTFIDIDTLIKLLLLFMENGPILINKNLVQLFNKF